MNDKLVVRYCSSINYDLDGLTIDEAIGFLQEQKKSLIGMQTGKRYSPIEQLKLSYDPEEYEDGYTLNLVGLGKETEAEEAKRLLAEKQQKEQAEAWDRRQLAALQKKYSK